MGGGELPLPFRSPQRVLQDTWGLVVESGHCSKEFLEIYLVVPEGERRCLGIEAPESGSSWTLLGVTGHGSVRQRPAYPPRMPLPLSIARFNKRYTNRFFEPLARRSSRFAVVRHVGRRSGAVYQTPVVVFEHKGALAVALTYGPSADWVRNVLGGSAQIERGGVSAGITDARVVTRCEVCASLPRVVRGALRVLRVRDFLLLQVSDSPGPL